MIYDVFTFNNELDLLELRFNILNDYVDFFVLVESTSTFSGLIKPLYYNDNLKRFKLFNHKVIHYIVDDTPTSRTDPNCDQDILEMCNTNSNVTHDHVCWFNEFYQKECIRYALDGLDDDDVCFISDVDEIWNYNLTYDINGDDILKPKINNCYFCYVDNRSSEQWIDFTGPIVTRYETINNNNLNDLRTLHKSKHLYTFMDDGGWHFNALGGIDKKIKDFSHPIYSNNYMINRVGSCVQDDNGLPEYILDNRLRYRHLFI